MKNLTDIFSIVSKPYRYARKLRLFLTSPEKIAVSKPYRYARKRLFLFHPFFLTVVSKPYRYARKESGRNVFYS